MEDDTNSNKKSPLKRFSEGIMNSIRSCDRYGNPVNLTYERDNEFKTHFGGV